MTQAVSRRAVTPKNGIDPSSVRMRLVVDKETTEYNFLGVIHFLLSA